jgi:DNA-binding NarL/FixJ family response regulator
VTALAARRAARCPANDRRAGSSIVIVDADRRVRRSLTELLRLGGVQVAAATGDAAEGLALVERLRPELVLVEASVATPAAGSQLVDTFRQRCPATAVLLMGWQDLAGAGPGANDAPYVSKGTSPHEFLQAILAALPTGSRH